MENVSEIILQQLKKVIRGKDEVIRMTLAAIFAGGHVLLEDMPGMGKTTLALGISKVFGLDFRRIQLTPDTVASDITGYSAYDTQSGTFRFHAGAAMTNLLLADELNRTSGKTQSALLEIMEEGRTTVDGVTYELPKPFNVIATQNPAGSAGTSEIPLSQLDRFMIRIKMGEPDRENLKNILKDRHHGDPLDGVERACSGEMLLEIQRQCENVFVSDEIYDYICDLCQGVNGSGKISAGISPRGALALCRMAKADAFLQGRDFVVPADVRRNFLAVCGHRVQLSRSAKISENSVESVLSEAVDKVPCPESKRVK